MKLTIKPTRIFSLLYGKEHEKLVMNQIEIQLEKLQVNNNRLENPLLLLQ